MRYGISANRATEPLIEGAIKVWLDRESYAYSTPAGVRAFAGAFIRRYGLVSASNSQRAVHTLLNRDLIDRDNGSFPITDRFFRIRIGRKQGIRRSADTAR